VVEQSVFSEVVFKRFKRQISSLLTNLLPGDEKSFTCGSFKARFTTENEAFLVQIEGPLNIVYGSSKKRDVVDYTSAFFAVYTLGCTEAKNTDVGRLQYVC